MHEVSEEDEKRKIHKCAELTLVAVVACPPYHRHSVSWEKTATIVPCDYVHAETRSVGGVEVGWGESELEFIYIFFGFILCYSERLWSHPTKWQNGA